MTSTLSPDDLRLRFLEASDLHLARPLWEFLSSSLMPGAITTGWPWVGSWISAFGDLIPHFFVVAERANTPVGIVLVTEGVGQRVGPIPVATLNIGTGGEPVGHGVFVEYNRVLCRDEDRPGFARRLFRFLRALPRSRGREIVFHGFAPEDIQPFIDARPGMFVRREPCPTTDLAAIRADHGNVVRALRKNTRNKVNRAMRRHGPISMEWVETGAAAADVFAELVALHQRRWTDVGEQGVFGSARFLAFHQALIPELLATGQLFLVRVRSAAGTIGCVYGFIEWGQVLFYQSGFSAGESEKHHPGLVTNVIAMQACLDRGLDAYNFLQGLSRYKQQLTNTERELVWAIDAPGGLKSAALMLARRRHYADTVVTAGSRGDGQA